MNLEWRLLLLISWVLLVFFLNPWPTDGKERPSAKAAWQINLREVYRFRSFQRPTTPVLWNRQQGIVFITPELFAVYQVSQTKEPAPLAPRDESGGSGNYYLRAAFFEAGSGGLVKQLLWTTSAEISQILPTHDGRFIVRTGNSVHLYSASFEEIRSLQLPLGRAATREWWEVGVSPSGSRLILGHVEEFGRHIAPKATLEVRDADTFDVLTRVHGGRISYWSAGDGFVTTPNPAGGLNQGVLMFDGTWRGIDFAVDSSCPAGFQALAHELVAAFGCPGLQVLSTAGEKRFWKRVDRKEAVVAVSNSGFWLAAEIDRKKPSLEFFFKSRPFQLAIFDLADGTEVSTVALDGKSVMFSISSNGRLAVIQDEQLTLFAAPADQKARTH